MRILGLVILLFAFAGCQEPAVTEQPAEQMEGMVEEEQKPPSEGSGTEQSEGSGTEEEGTEEEEQE